MQFIQARVRLNKLWGFLLEKLASELLPQTKDSQKCLNHLQYLHVEDSLLVSKLFLLVSSMFLFLCVCVHASCAVGDFAYLGLFYKGAVVR